MDHSIQTVNDSMEVRIRYTNHRGQTKDRRIIPEKIEFEMTQWHPKAQWILHAFDIDKNAKRSFALNDVQSWDGKAQ